VGIIIFSKCFFSSKNLIGGLPKYPRVNFFGGLVDFGKFVADCDPSKNKKECCLILSRIR
jgi:hypothetical protein